MKWAAVAYRGRTVVGHVDVAQGLFWPWHREGVWLTAMMDLIVDEVHRDVRVCADEKAILLAEVRLCAPFTRKGRPIFGIGMNYRSHLAECLRAGGSVQRLSDALPRAPIVFAKLAETVIGPGEAIVYPYGASQAVDYEAELAVVIGRGGQAIPLAQAMDHVFGYTIVNDVTARDVQDAHREWFLAKSMAGFCPMGPYVVSADEVDPGALSVRCWVNGELRQDGHTGDLIFSVPELIHHVSRVVALQPGDVIATGTPAGVGMGFQPPRYLRPGDVVEIEVSGLGRLMNTVV